jgi:hypothetical protein
MSKETGTHEKEKKGGILRNAGRVHKEQINNLADANSGIIKGFFIELFVLVKFFYEFFFDKKKFKQDEKE